MLIVNVKNITEETDLDSPDSQENQSYAYHVYVNRDLIGVGVVNGHDRREGWPNLLRMVADAAEKQ